MLLLRSVCRLLGLGGRGLSPARCAAAVGLRAPLASSLLLLHVCVYLVLLCSDFHCFLNEYPFIGLSPLQRKCHTVLKGQGLAEI